VVAKKILVMCGIPHHYGLKMKQGANNGY